MTIRKKTIDNSVKYNTKGEQTREIKPNTIKNRSTSRKQNRIFSQNNKKFLGNTLASGFKFVK